MAANSSTSRVALTDDLLDRFIIVPEYKLLFCYIEKVACKSFNNVFRSIRAKWDPRQAENGPFRKNTWVNHSWSKEMLEEAMADESWHKAVFFRNPVERFTSAWASKCRGPDRGDRDGPRHCIAQFEQRNVSFWGAVHKLHRMHVSGLDQDFDPHWRPQAHFCGGLANTLQYYKTVQELTPESSRDKVIKMLEEVGVNVKEIPYFDDSFPRAGEEPTYSPQHNTDAQDQAPKYLQDKPWLARQIVSTYKQDCDLFNLQLPKEQENSVGTDRQ